MMKMKNVNEPGFKITHYCRSFKLNQIQDYMKTKNLITTILTAVMFAAQIQFSIAQKADKSLDGWTLLGTRTVDYTLDRDVVSVKESSQKFTSLKFVVNNGTLNMHKCTVHFKNGDTQDINFADEVNKSNDGRMMDLKGNSRAIEKITFWYDTKNSSNNQSIVEVWGKG